MTYITATELKIFFITIKMFYIVQLTRYPLFPGTGKEYEKGKYGNIVNIPLPAGTNSENYLNAYEHILKK